MTWQNKPFTLPLASLSVDETIGDAQLIASNFLQLIELLKPWDVLPHEWLAGSPAWLDRVSGGWTSRWLRGARRERGRHHGGRIQTPPMELILIGKLILKNEKNKWTKNLEFGNYTIAVKFYGRELRVRVLQSELVWCEKVKVSWVSLEVGGHQRWLVAEREKGSGREERDKRKGVAGRLGLQRRLWKRRCRQREMGCVGGPRGRLGFFNFVNVFFFITYSMSFLKV